MFSKFAFLLQAVRYISVTLSEYHIPSSTTDYPCIYLLTLILVALFATRQSDPSRVSAYYPKPANVDHNDSKDRRSLYEHHCCYRSRRHIRSFSHHHHHRYPLGPAQAKEAKTTCWNYGAVRQEEPGDCRCGEGQCRSVGNRGVLDDQRLNQLLEHAAHPTGFARVCM